ncbi:MAG TPA: immunoglobulin domain-containing protein, partial [Gemmataceae bacterium]|nr:immunoglobulin domain-containing protein [Gemmataceae bacterium]
VNTNGSPATAGNVVFSLVDPKGTVVSNGPTGVAIGSNGQASDTLTVPAGTAAGSYSLSVAYTNNGQTTTQAFTGALTINTPSSAPVITTNPSNESVTVGQTATFTASASGNPTPTVQWQVSYDGGNTFSNLSGAKLTTLTLLNVPTASDGVEFRAVFTNSAGSETTSAATLTVAAALPSPPAPTPAPSPSIPDQIQQLVQDVVLMGQSLSNGDIAAFGQALQNYESLLVTVELELFQMFLNDLAPLLNS